MLYYDKLIFELSKEGRLGVNLPNNQFDDVKLNNDLLRLTDANSPEVSELDVVRHYTNVSAKNFGVETGFYPLGSCTMKYNPKINDQLATLPGFSAMHPLTPAKNSQGFLKVYYDLANYLSNLTGMDAYSLNTYAGAHGELAGLMIMKKYHQDRGDFKRTKIIIPDSAHGTNPASATVAGFEVIEVKSNLDGTVNIKDLKLLLSDEIAGLMLTNPNTVGMFEKDIEVIAELIHGVGGLVYYDGANLNALLGLSRPGDMGFDITHLNLHKTFSTPHGGGGPGSGPVGVKEFLRDYLPGPVVSFEDDLYNWTTPTKTIGPLSAFYGNASVYLRAYVYIRTLGRENLKMIGKLANLNANYIKDSLKDLYKLPIDDICMHEFVFDGLKDQSTDVKTLDIAKRLLDYGVHAPTIYFPLTYAQSLMIEPTEVESLETINNFIEVMRMIALEAKETPELVKNAPHNTIVKRLDEATAARKPLVKFSDLGGQQ